jgi:hypothetical protein
VPERHLFVGHLHRWLVMTPGGQLNWRGEGPVKLGEEPRYLVVVAAVVCGWCAVYDTAETELTPVRCAD